MVSPDSPERTIAELIRRFGSKQPQFYRIVVRGQLSSDWLDRLGGLTATSIPVDEEPLPLTVLEGRILDQAQLSGVLNTLYELRLVLLGVEVLEGSESDLGKDTR